MNEAELVVLWRDERFVVVHKPAGLLVHRTAIDAHDERSLVRSLREQLGGRVYPVHRLDKGTAGATLLALDRETAERLARGFREGRVGKKYVAVVRGHVDQHSLVETPLRDAIDGGAMRPACTEVRRLAIAELPYAVGPYATARYSLVDCQPRSGRQHQVRRHLKHLRHPVIGDANYGDLRHNRFFRSQLGIDRLLLAATQLSFDHPHTACRIDVRAPLDEGFMAACRALGWATADGLAGAGNAVAASAPLPAGSPAMLRR